jgi:hypothetical protein
MNDKAKTDKMQKQESSQKQEEPTKKTEPTIPPATTGEVLRYLRQNDYHFSGSEKETGIIYIHKERGEGTKERRITKSILEDIEAEKDFLTDYERLQYAFEGFQFKRKKTTSGTGGREAEKQEAFVSRLRKEGINSSSAGVLTLNVAKLFGLASEKIQNRKGESVEGYEQQTFQFEWDEEKKEARITKDRRKK